MKTLLCSDLGGPSDCDHKIIGDTFEELGQNSKAHVMEMLGGGDKEHMAAVERMKSLSPEEQHKEFASYKEKFETASN